MSASMQSDEQQIRDLISAWHAATMAGDVDAVLAMMTDDVVFLTPGRAPMDKQEFAALSRPPAGGPRPSMDIQAAIEEVQVAGAWAFVRTRLSVAITQPGGAVMERAGHTLSVVQRIGDTWLLSRDANLLAPVAKPAASPAQ